MHERPMFTVVSSIFGDVDTTAKLQHSRVESTLHIILIITLSSGSLFQFKLFSRVHFELFAELAGLKNLEIRNKTKKFVQKDVFLHKQPVQK